MPTSDLPGPVRRAQGERLLQWGLTWQEAPAVLAGWSHLPLAAQPAALTDLLDVNVYALAGVGVAWARLEELATQKGVPHLSQRRVQAGLVEVATHQAAQAGHTFMDPDTLVRRAARLVNVEAGPVRRQLQQCLAAGTLVAPHPARVYAAQVWRQETELAQLIYAGVRAQGALPTSSDRHWGTALARLEVSQESPWHPQQRTAVQRVFARRFSVLTGGAGDGQDHRVAGYIGLVWGTGSDLPASQPHRPGRPAHGAGHGAPRPDPACPPGSAPRGLPWAGARGRAGRPPEWVGRGLAEVRCPRAGGPPASRLTC